MTQRQKGLHYADVRAFMISIVREQFDLQLRQYLGSDKRLNGQRLQNRRTPLPPHHKLSQTVLGKLLNVLHRLPVSLCGRL